MAGTGRCSKELMRSVSGSWMFWNYSRLAVASLSCVSTRCLRHRPLECASSLAKTARCTFATTTSSAAYTTSGSDLQSEEVLTIRKVDGLYELSVPMVSRRENCRFTLQPFEKTLNDLFDSIHQEDRAIDVLQAQTTDGEILSATTGIDSLLKRNFYLVVNDVRYLVEIDQTATDRLRQLPDSSDAARLLVASLYRTVSLDQYYAVRHRQLLAQQTELLLKLEPLEKRKIELQRRAEKRTRLLSWVGLGLMGAQFGFMARLTWWEYSWDIMEPVTYFVGYATTIAMFSYYVITRQEYLYPEVREREFLVTLHRRSKTHQFDVAIYNELQAQLARVERDLRRLRDPLEVQLVLPHLPLQTSDQ